MALTTSRLGLPYPERPDTADVPRDVEALAVASDILVPYRTGPFASRPATPAEGTIYRSTDKTPGDPDWLTFYDGTSWDSIAFTLTIPDRSVSHIKLILGTIMMDEMVASSV